MEILIHVNLRKLDKDYQQAVNEYIKRTSPYCKIKLALYKDPSKIQVMDSSFVYVVVPSTDTLSSEDLAREITAQNLAGYSRLEFIILDSSNQQTKSTSLCEATKKAKDFSISSFALSPDLTTCVLTEQIYRAYTILNNITYHK